MRVHHTALLVVVIALALVAAIGIAGATAAAPATVHQDFLPDVLNPPPTSTPTTPRSPTATVSFSPFWTITATPSPSLTAIPLPSCNARQVETFEIDGTHSAQTMGIASIGELSTNLTAWITVTGYNQLIEVQFYNQWQYTGSVEVAGQGIVLDVVPHPGGTVIVLNNAGPDKLGTTEFVQVTSQACAGEWPSDVSSPTPTP